MAETVIKVILEGQDKLTPTVKRASEGVDKLAKSVSTLDRLSKMRGHLDSIGNKMMIAGAGLAAGLGLHEVIRDSAAAEHQLAALANIANLGHEKMIAIQQRLSDATLETNQSMLELIGGVQTLMGKGWSDDLAMKAIAPIGKAATASLADVGDLSRTVFAAVDNLKVPVENTTKLLDILADAGKQGSFELKDMAKHFPALTAQANLMKINGISGASQIAAALQIAMKGASDPDIAANNMKNFLTKITAPTTVTKFAKVGVNLESEFNKGVAGGDVIGHMVELVQRLTGGSQFKMGKLFEDMQVKDFIAPMIQNLEEYRRIQRRSLGADGVLEHDYGVMMGSLTEQWKRLKLVTAKVVMPAIAPYLKKIGEFLSKINPKQMQKILGVIVGLVAGGLLLKVTSGIIGMASALSTLGVSGASLSALAWPVALLAIGGYLVWKHWDKVGPVFEGVATNLGEAFSSLGNILGMMKSQKSDLDQFNDSLSATEVIAVVLAKALAAVAYGLSTVMAGIEAGFAQAKLVTDNIGPFLDALQGGHLITAGKIAANVVTGFQPVGMGTFLNRMEKNKNPFADEGGSGYFQTVARNAAAQAPAVVQGGPVTINVDGSKDPKATADEVGKYLRENNIDIARMMSAGLQTANRGAY